jgi:hypothetical protein
MARGRLPLGRIATEVTEDTEKKEDFGPKVAAQHGRRCEQKLSSAVTIESADRFTESLGSIRPSL